MERVKVEGKSEGVGAREGIGDGIIELCGGLQIWRTECQSKREQENYPLCAWIYLNFHRIGPGGK